MFDILFADAADDALVAAIERARWKFDTWANTAAQIGAALTISQRRASGQMHIAVALRERLPKVAALYCRGRLSVRLVSELTWCTSLIEDGRLVGLIDDAPADAPEAVRRAKEQLKNRDFSVGASEDGAETTSAWGLLMAADAIVVQRRITATVNTVCDNDPRTIPRLPQSRRRRTGLDHRDPRRR